MIIDCHGHFTTAPEAHTAWRRAQLDGHASAYPVIGDDELRACVEPSQLARMDERGIDLTLFSPRASTMGPHLGDAAASRAWTAACNDLVARVVGLYPDRFAGVAQLPQSPGTPPAESLAELRRCVLDLGFVGANLNPDPSGGRWSGPSLADPAWFPVWEALVELGVPAMVHVSASAVPGVHTTGPHYLGADTTAYMQLLDSDVFARYPTLRLVIPHGGGAAPFHWGRFAGLAQMLGRPGPADLAGHVLFDTCVYHQAGVDHLLSVVGPEAVLFGSETFGAVRGVDPATGHHYDDTRRYVEAAALSDTARTAVLGGNALRVYPRLERKPA